VSQRGVAVRDSPQTFDDDLAAGLWEAGARRVGLDADDSRRGDRSDLA